MALARSVSLMATLWAVEPMVISCRLPPVATVTVAGSSLNSLRWTVAEAGAATAGPPPPPALASSMARAPNPTATRAVKRAMPAITTAKAIKLSARAALPGAAGRPGSSLRSCSDTGGTRSVRIVMPPSSRRDRSTRKGRRPPSGRDFGPLGRLEHHRHPLVHTHAHGGEPVPAAPPGQFVGQGADDPCPGAPQRVTEGESAAVGVHDG